MRTLREIFNDSNFACGVELVSTRGTIFEPKIKKALNFGDDLTSMDEVDWVSITDNAGGNPMLSPLSLANQIKNKGKEIIIHLSGKDFNRNGLESQLWLLESEGFKNILALTGDAPISGIKGVGKPVFDLDSIGLLSLVEKMNRGLYNGITKANIEHRLKNTNLFAGAVVSNFKMYESELLPQLMKLKMKVNAGAKFIINQIGYDARKMQELIAFMQLNGMKEIPLIGNVFALNGSVAKIFNSNIIPGVVVSSALLDLCTKHARSVDKGKAFFHEFAAKQMAIYKGLGYKGVYFGGVHKTKDLHNIMTMEKSFSLDDWKQFTSEVNYSKPNEFFFFDKKEKTSLSNVTKMNKDIEKFDSSYSLSYRFSEKIHDLMFTENKGMFSFGKNICKGSRDSFQGPLLMRKIEHISKSMMFACKDCGDCSLPETAFLCPESQCAKNQRNGPCGGTLEGKCEVLNKECIWSKAYKRLKTKGEHLMLLNHVPAVQDQGLRGTSSWANSWLKRDHIGKKDIE